MSVPLNRRAFVAHGLAAVGLATSASVLASCAVLVRRDARIAAVRRHERLIIVGAGIAGLAAAAELRSRGFEDIVVLEARHRVGGRIWTDRLGHDKPVDLGASWIHGVKGNPIAAIARDNAIETSATDYGNQVVHLRVGHEPPQQADDVLQQIMAAARRRPHASLQVVYDGYLAANDLDDDLKRYVDYRLNTAVEHEFGTGIGNLSLRSMTGARASKGHDAVFPAGYAQIVDILCSGLDIRRGEAVTAIDYGGSSIALTTASGTVYAADRVVVTVPLGVLKARAISFFPALPDRKRRAIERLDMGVLNKTCLLFDDVFWNEDAEFIGYVGAQRGQWAETLSLYPHSGVPILMLFNAGSYATAIEGLSDQETVALAVAALADMHGAVPPPKDARVTRWRSDPWSRGAYSYVPVGATFAQYAELGAPVGDGLFFAGEATSADHPATVHGAYISGIRAARQVAARGNARRIGRL